MPNEIPWEIILASPVPEWEYVCAECKQFRLYMRDNMIPKRCGNCGSGNIFVAKTGTIKLRGES